MMLTREQLLSIAKSDPEALVHIILSLQEQVQMLTKRVSQLEEQINKNSHNSSKPPSSDGMKKPKKTKSLRKRSGKKRGGQKGHKGHHLEKAETPDYIIPLPVTSCLMIVARYLNCLSPNSRCSNTKAR
jgi:transposase